ncbi:MAG: hypothetical protein AAF629_02490, partial [Chloroflexota bacterium]
DDHGYDSDQIQRQKMIRSRRTLLKALVGASASGIFVGLTLPKTWVKPSVEIGVLPAHAQVSAPNSALLKTLIVVARWEDNVNLNLRVEEPDLTQVQPDTPLGPTLIHAGDTVFEERVFNAQIDVVRDGLYRVYLDWPSTTQLTTTPEPKAMVEITTHTASLTLGPLTTLDPGGSQLVAILHFPAGDIQAII